VDHWHPHFVRSQTPDAVGQWADLEGKSPAMSHDLHCRYAAATRPKKSAAVRIGIVSELLIATIELLCHARSR
jgi:hypothetical protein